MENEDIDILIELVTKELDSGAGDDIKKLNRLSSILRQLNQMKH